MRIESLAVAALIAAALLTPPAATAASLEVTKGSDARRPFVFALKGDAGEPLCLSPGFKSAAAARKASKAAVPSGKALGNYLFQKKTDAKGDHHWWELRDKKKKHVLCTSDTLEDFGKVEHSAGEATKAFAKAQPKG